MTENPRTEQSTRSAARRIPKVAAGQIGYPVDYVAKSLRQWLQRTVIRSGHAAPDRGHTTTHLANYRSNGCGNRRQRTGTQTGNHLANTVDRGTETRHTSCHATDRHANRIGDGAALPQASRNAATDSRERTPERRNRSSERGCGAIAKPGNRLRRNPITDPGNQNTTADSGIAGQGRYTGNEVSATNLTTRLLTQAGYRGEYAAQRLGKRVAIPGGQPRTEHSAKIVDALANDRDTIAYCGGDWLDRRSLKCAYRAHSLTKLVHRLTSRIDDIACAIERHSHRVGDIACLTDT